MSIRNKLTYRHTVMTCYLTYIASAAVNNLASLLFVTFQSSFGISTTQLATLITFNFGTQILVDLLGARYVDRIGYRLSAMIAGLFSFLGLMFLGVLPIAMENTYVALCISAVTYAVGSGLSEVLISPMIEALPGKAKESAMSILHSFYCWGHVLMVLLSTLYLTTVQADKWYFLPMLWSIVPLVTVGLFAVVPIKTLNDSTPSMPMKQLFGKRLFWLFILLMFCGGAAEQAMTQWASLFAESALGVSKAVGNLLGPCLFAVMMGLARLLYGKYSERLPLLRALCLCGALTIGGYLVVSLVPDPYISLTGCGMIGLGVGIFWPGVLSVSSKRIPAGGTAMFGLLALAGDLGCSAGPALAAEVSKLQNVSFSRTGLLACIIFPAVITVATFFLLRQKETHSVSESAVPIDVAEKTATGIKSLLKCEHNVRVFEQIGSTNTFLKEEAENGSPGGQVCIALTQSAGRGRCEGRKFLSFGEGLYLSLLYRPGGAVPAADIVKITCAAAVAVCGAIRDVTSLPAEIKWVNDICINGKKVCGILTEGAISGGKKTYDYIVVGIGVNLVSEQVPGEIVNVAGSLYESGDSGIPDDLRIRLAAEIINRFDQIYTECIITRNTAPMVDIYRKMSLIPGKEINVIRRDGTFPATAISICDDCSLAVKYDNGMEERLNSGEVSLKLKQ